MKVFVVSVESVRDYENCNTKESISVFKSRELAYAKMLSEIESAKIDYDNVDYVIEEEYLENGDCFFDLYEQGYYPENHCRIDLMEKEVI